jgi:hypothetical protein
MIPRKASQSQNHLPDNVAWSTRGGPPPATPDPDTLHCPLCGRSPAPYDQRASTLLDRVLLLEAVIADLKKAAEELAL